jgi:hypothetical protein
MAEPVPIRGLFEAHLTVADLDGHQLEDLAIPDAEPRPETGIVAWSEWAAS